MTRARTCTHANINKKQNKNKNTPRNKKFKTTTNKQINKINEYPFMHNTQKHFKSINTNPSTSEKPYVFAILTACSASSVTKT